MENNSILKVKQFRRLECDPILLDEMINTWSEKNNILMKNVKDVKYYGYSTALVIYTDEENDYGR